MNATFLTVTVGLCLAGTVAQAQPAATAAGDGTPVVVVRAGPGTSEAELFSPRSDRSQCDELERPLVRPVIPTLREESLGRLANQSVLELTEVEAARLIGAHVSKTATLASSLMQEFLEELRSRKNRAEIEHRDSWSLADEEDLTRLTGSVAAGVLDNHKVYLVKAATGGSNEPVLFGELCGTKLDVSALLLGNPAPSTVWPAVVFLPRRPTSVVATVEYAL